MAKYLAHIITGLRIIGSGVLLFFDALSFPFYITYLLCGFSDMIDGAMARKMGAVSKFGAKPDTVADFVFMAVCVVQLLPMINLAIWLWIWIGIITMIKVTGIVWGLVRRKELVALHTVFNKITGSLLFLLPFTLQFIQPTYSFAVVCAIATIAAIQEGYDTIKVNDK